MKRKVQNIFYSLCNRSTDIMVSALYFLLAVLVIWIGFSYIQVVSGNCDPGNLQAIGETNFFRIFI